MGTPLSLFLFSEECPHASEGLQTGSGQGAVRFLQAVVHPKNPNLLLLRYLYNALGPIDPYIVPCLDHLARVLVEPVH